MSLSPLPSPPPLPNLLSSPPTSPLHIPYTPRTSPTPHLANSLSILTNTPSVVTLNPGPLSPAHTHPNQEHLRYLYNHHLSAPSHFEIYVLDNVRLRNRHSSLIHFVHPLCNSTFQSPIPPFLNITVQDMSHSLSDFFSACISPTNQINDQHCYFCNSALSSLLLHPLTVHLPTGFHLLPDAIDRPLLLAL
jgi:hypothetical protein